MTTTLSHRAQLAPVIVSVTIRLDIGLLFWPVFALAWLIWLNVGKLGRWLRGCREWWSAAGRVAKRRWQRWVDSWKADLGLMGLAVREMMGETNGHLWPV
jgi:hypothetical protein